MRLLKRNLERKARLMLDIFPVVSIQGSRQCGKTSFAKQLVPDWKCFDLENMGDFDKITHDPRYFFEEFPRHIVIDEAQLYPDLFKILRGVCDSKPGEKGRFILTGSSNPELLKGISESLAGRIGIIEMGTLKFNEYYQRELSPFYNIFCNPARNVNRELFDNLLSSYASVSNTEVMHVFMYGGYPEPILQDSTFFKFWMEDYKNTYINRDIARLYPKINRVAFRRFLEMLSQLSGTILNKSDIARSVEVSEGTIREYVQILAGTYIWRNLISYEENVIKSVIKMPKGLIADSGLENYLLKIPDQDGLIMHPNLGRLFECFVIEEIIKGLQATPITNWQPYYYRTRDGAEIDLILSGEFGVIPIEIKYGSTILLRKLKTLENFVLEHKCPFGILINNAAKVEWIRPNIVQVPVGML